MYHWAHDIKMIEVCLQTVPANIPGLNLIPEGASAKFPLTPGYDWARLLGSY